MRLPVHLVALAIALAGAGCGTLPPPAPNANAIRPSARIEPLAVAAGAPIAVTYGWELPASGKAPGGHWRAFVHFLDRHGGLLFTDDHEPVPPPASWQPGASYSYRRVVLTPEFPYAGVVAVAMGLFDESSGERLVLGGNDLGQRRSRVAELELRPRDRELPVRCEGFYEPEASLAAPLTVWRFMGRSATCSFPNPRESAVVFVRADIEPDAFRAAPRLAMVFKNPGGAAVRSETELPLAAEPTLIRVRVDGRALGTGPDATVRLRMSDAYRPAAFGFEDPRELSLRVFGVHVARASATTAALLADPGEAQ